MSKSVVMRTWLRSANGGRAVRRPDSRAVLELRGLEDRVTPTVQFAAAGETVAATAGGFSIQVTDTGTPPPPVVTTFVSGFSTPYALAFDAAGNLYVANYNANTVSRVTPAGAVSTFASGLSGPTGLAFDAAGDLYVANYGNSTVSRVTPAGAVSTFASGFSYPYGLAFDAAGDLYVANNGNNTVSRVTPAGAVSTFASGFSNPVALAFDAAGNLYVANYGNSTVSRVTPAGAVSTFASGFSYPYGLAFDAAGDLYVPNYGNNTVSRVTPAGAVSTFASGFSNPVALAFDAAGDLYVANYSNSTVSRVSPGTVTVPFTLGGTAVAGTDYTLTTASPVTFARGATSRTVTGTLTPNGTGTKTLTFTLGTPTGDALGSPGVNTLTIAEPAPPTLAGVTPNTVVAGGPDATVTLTGTGFLPGGTAASYGGVALVTTYVSPTRATATIPAASLAAPGGGTLTVATTAGTTAGRPFTVTPAATVQFAAAGETVAATAGVFSVQVTATGTPPPPVVTTFASGFNNPTGLAFDAAGNLYVANAGAGTVRKVTPAGAVSTFASGLSGPTGLAFDAAGNLYVANAGDGTVSKVTPAGAVSTFASGFNNPTGLAFDAAGNLYVANAGDGTVSKVTPAGAVSTFASGLSGPTGLAFDAAGNLYVANAGDGTVSKVTPAGAVSTFASGLSSPRGLAFDAAGNLYVVGIGAGTVSRVTPAGAVSTFASGLSSPYGLAFDAAGDLYVANYGNHTVSRVSPGTVTVPFTLGGTAVAGTDYTLTTASPVTFARGATSRTVTGTLTPNGTGTKTLTFTLGTPTGGGLGSPGVNTLTITEPIAITSAAPPNPTTGQAYSFPVTTAGGAAPVAFTITAGTLPAGLTLNSGTGVISGTPTAAGSFPVTVTATDADAKTATQADTLTVSDPLAIATLTLPVPNVGQAYSTPVATTGGRGPNAFAVTAGSLPAGLTLNAATGVVRGTPTAAGAYSVTVQATDADGRTASRPYTGTVAAVAVTSAPPTAPTTGQPYNFPVTAGGGTGPYTFAVTSGTLPAGLTLAPATGVISGTPTATGASPFTVTAADADGNTGAQADTLTVSDPLGVGPAALAPTTNGQPFTQAETTTGGGGTKTFAVTAGSLPAGLTLAPATGVISGTPTVDGPVTFTVTATDADGRTAAVAYSGTVVEPLAVATASVPPLSKGVAYATPVVATGGRGADTFAVAAGTLPAGLTLDPATGVIGGTPTANGPFAFAVTATDLDGRTATSPTFAGTVTDPLAVTTTSIAPVTKGVAYATPVVATGGRGADTFAVAAGTLPAGLTLDPATGVIGGTPTANGPFAFAVTATDLDGRAATSPTFAGTVTDPLAVTTLTLPVPTRGQPYSQPVNAAGGQSPRTFAATGTLPPGLSVNPATGVVSGTPTADGLFGFTVTATDPAGRTAARTYSETVSDPLALTTPALPPQTVGQAYSTPVVATGGRGPNAFAVSAGTLPAGVALDPATGVISGTPTAAGPFAFAVTATDADGRAGSQPYAGAVSDPLAVTTAALAVPTRGQPFTTPVATAGGRGPNAFAVTAGTLPAGLAIDAAAGTIGGTPTADGTFPFTVTATDADGRVASKPFTLQVTDPVAVTPATFPVATRGRPLTQAEVATGGNGAKTFAVTAGTLPAGLTLAPATGVMSGTPTATGPFAFTVTATDVDGRAGSQPYAGAVSNPLAVTTAALATAYRGTAYSTPVAATGGRGPNAFAVTAGTLPAGLTLNPSTGVIGGTPTATGSVTVTVTATDADGRVAAKALTLAVADPVTFPVTTLADGTTGARLAQAVTAAGGVAPLTYAVTAGALPVGVDLDAATGTVTGVPSTAGASAFTVTATDSTGVKGMQPYTIAVADPPSVIGTGTLPDGIVQFAYAQAVPVTGGTGPYAFAVSAGALPPGLTLRANGTLAGTPTAGGAYNFTVTLTDARGRTASRPEAVTIDAGSNLSRVFAVGAGNGGGARVRVFDRATGAGTADFFAFETTFRGGVNVVVGDVNGDGVPDVVVSAGGGGGARVMAIDGTKLDQVDADGRIASSAQLANFFAFDEALRGGATVALARLDGGRGLDIVVGAGAGGGPRVRTFALTPGAAGGVTQLPGAIGSFFAFDPSQRFGVTVAAGNLDGTGVDSVIVGQGPGGPPQVAVFRADGSVRQAFTASNLAPQGGVSVAAGYLDGTNSVQLVLGTGPGGPPLVNVYKGTDTTPERTVAAFEPEFRGGVAVNSGPVGQQSDIFLGAGVGGGPRVRVLTPDGLQELYDFFGYELTFRGGVNVG